eukprot:Nk52_evm4s277 gene=Nk52_evmTU4s277
MATSPPNVVLHAGIDLGYSTCRVRYESSSFSSSSSSSPMPVPCSGELNLQGCLAITDDGFVYGEEVLNRSTLPEQNRIQSIKKLLLLARDTRDPGGDDRCHCVFRGRPVKLKREEIIGAFLKEIKRRIVSRVKGVAVQCIQCVLAVPFGLSLSKRALLRRACVLADLELLWFVDDLTSVAFTRRLRRGVEEGCSGRVVHVIVDVGAGGLSAGIVGTRQGEGRRDGQGEGVEVEVLWGFTDFEACGEKIDALMVDWVREQIGGTMGIRTLGRIKAECERKKQILSVSEHTVLEVDVEDGRHIVLPLKRAEFEKISRPVLDRIRDNLASLRTLLEKLDNGNVLQGLLNQEGSSVRASVLLLVGGLCRIPAVQGVVRQVFPEMVPSPSVSSLYAVHLEGSSTVGALYSCCTTTMETPHWFPSNVTLRSTGGDPQRELYSAGCAQPVGDVNAIGKMIHVPVGVNFVETDLVEGLDGPVLYRCRISGRHHPLASSSGHSGVRVEYRMDARGSFYAHVIPAGEGATYSNGEVCFVDTRIEDIFNLGHLMLESKEESLKVLKVFEDAGEQFREKIEAHNRLESYIIGLTDVVQTIEGLAKSNREWLEAYDRRTTSANDIDLQGKRLEESLVQIRGFYYEASSNQDMSYDGNVIQ